MVPDITLNSIPFVFTGGVMKKLLSAEIVIIAFGVTQAIAAAGIFVANNYPWLLRLLLLLTPAALGGVAWITLQVFKSLPNVLSKVSALLGWSGFLVACLGGVCSYFLNTPYTVQIVSWGVFAWIVGVYVTLTWAKLWKRKQLGPAPDQGVQTSDVLPQPRLGLTQNSHCPELVVVERWLCVINELKQDSCESTGSNTESEQINCSIRETAKEEQNLVSSQRDVVLLMRASRQIDRTQSSSPPGHHHRQDHHQHRRTRCVRPAPSQRRAAVS